MRLHLAWILVLGLGALVAAPETLAAQTTGTVTGVVTDANGAPLAGAAVAVANTTLGSTTGADGSYTITGVPAGARQVRATFGGHQEAQRTVTVVAGQSLTLNIQLVPQVFQLEELVAIGYGTATRRDLTGAIGSVSAEDLATGGAPVTAVSGALIGRTPGVQVVSNTGTPGASATVRIRGTNSITATSDPLYVIDGIPLSPGSTPLTSIDPNNIESIQILKDASSTAIYGARGANGVVLINTSRGTRGVNQLSMETSYGWQRPTKFIEALSGPQFRQLMNEGLINAGRPPRFTQEQIDNAPTFDYPRALLRDLEWQPQQSHSLAASGGNSETRYLVAGNYVDQQGMIINSGFSRVGGRLNLDQTVSSRFRLGANLSGTRTTQRVNAAESTGTGAVATGLTVAVQYDPTVMPQDPETGVWNTRTVLNENYLNPLTESTGRQNPNYVTAVLASVYGEFDIMEGLLLRSTGGANLNFRRQPSYAPAWIGSGEPIGVASQFSSERRELTNENILTFRREVGPGSLEAMAGTSIQTSYYEDFSASARGMVVDQLAYYDLGAGSEVGNPSANVTDWTLLSQFGRVNYNLLQRYLFTVTARRDGSSRFGANNKWALFPSAAFAWRVIDEPFMSGQDMLSDLKFRISYGRTGNQAISEYQSLARMSTGFLAIGGREVVTLFPAGAAPNPDLKWETQDQYNLGVDLGIFDNRVVLTADMYQSSTSNLLLSRQIARPTGFTSQLQNVGAVRNRGVEASISTVNWEGNRFHWATTLNLAANRNEVVRLFGGLDRLSPTSGTQVGQPLGTFVGHKVLGLYQQGDTCELVNPRDCEPGEYKLLDVNGDGLITAEDVVNLGSPQSDFYGGFNNRMRYGRLELDAFFNFSVGNKINNTSMRFLGLVGGASNERADRSLRRWTPQNTNTDVPRANIERVTTRTYSTYIEDGSFLRLQSLNLAYQLPAGLVPGTSAARINVTGQNLWITTKYSGYDPENQAVDPGGYPRARSWNFGLNLTF